MSMYIWGGHSPVMGLGSAGPGNWPGQAGNPVGFANTPAAAPARWTGNGVWPGAYPGSLTTYTGSDITTSGTAGSYLQFNFIDFTGTGGQVINGSFIKFIGCRFQGQSAAGGLAEINGGSHHEFYYCSFVPLVSVQTQPPSGGGYTLWPTGGTGQGQQPDRTDGSGLPNLGWKPFAISQTDGYQYSIRCYGNGNVLIDHCDMWGFGNSVVMGTSSPFITMGDSWLHDCRWCGDTGTDHTDGFGYLDSAVGPTDVTVDHCTITAEGVEDGLAAQGNTAGYTRWVVKNSYFTGWDHAFFQFSAPNLGCRVTDNVFGTEVPWTFDAASATNSWYTGRPNGNQWSNNTLKIYPGSSDKSQVGSPKWDNTMNGYFIWPDGTYHATDFV